MQRLFLLILLLSALPAHAVPLTLPDGVTVTGYLETSYTHDFSEPPAGVMLLRSFDNRSDMFLLENAVVDVAIDRERIMGRLALQIGQTPNSYYRAELTQPGGTGVGLSSADTWKFLQQAWLGVHLDEAGQWTAQAGLFLSPIGPETVAVKENWNWSRSNLFTALPYYHLGVRLNFQPVPEWTLTAALYNGWNAVVDVNGGKSVSLQSAWAGKKVQASLLYFGGTERPEPARAEGNPWRHLVDAWAQVQVLDWLAFMLHVDGGFEDTELQGGNNRASWLGVALYGRAQLPLNLALAARVDTLSERRAQDVNGAYSQAFLLPVSRLSSATGTLEWKPSTHLLLRAEARLDGSLGDAFASGPTTLVNGEPLANAHQRLTTTLGAVANF